MCLQCVADGATYVGGAVGALQVLKVRARRRRTSTGREPVDVPTQERPTMPTGSQHER